MKWGIRMIKLLTNKDKNFYLYFGKIFGSRLIENTTKDRIYDDDNKIWHCEFIKNKIVSFISVENHKIKNIYCDKSKSKEFNELLCSVFPNVAESIVPKIYKDYYISAGFTVIEEKQNFVKIKGGYNEEKN